MAELTAGVELAGRFRLTRLLGRGGNAEVWAATERSSGAEVALRVLAAADPPGAAALALGLQADADRLSRLVHPGILRPLSVLADGTLVCVAFEVADRGDLGAMRGQGYQAIVAAIREVADALQYVHAQGQTHGDLKAGNVLLDRQGRWRLTDFRSTQLPGSGPLASLSTISPQQLDGAPPTPADDIYSLGALLYDLLAGQPPLHPGINPERIRTEVPPRLGVDGQGQAVPVALTQLVAAMLEKSPTRRPGSLGAVRSLLAEIVAPAVRRPALLPGAQPVTGDPVRRRATVVASRSPVLVGAGLLLLVAAVLAVVVWLPRVVSERGPLITAAPAPAPSSTSASGPAPPTAPDGRAAAATARSERQRSEAAARAAGADRWGGAEWLEARRLAERGDTRFLERDFEAAAASLNQAARQFDKLAGGAPAALAAALQAGQAAYERADQPAALAAFERAVLIRPGEPTATRGLTRSQQLDDILRAMAEGAAREAAGEVSAASGSYAGVLKLDSEWGPARAALRRLDAGRAAGEFERAMAQGLSALAAGRTADARSALNRALALRPGDAGARSAVEQLDSAERRRQLAGLQSDAEALAVQERWADAAGKYRELLGLDATLAAATTGLATAEARAQLHERLEQQLANAERFNDDRVVAVAQAVVSEAETVTSKGPGLLSQTARLKALLAAAARPLPVEFASDNLTRVVIYTVGELGTFTSRTVELRPGTYVVVGTRAGYRDVRRNVKIAATGNPEPILVRCEETI